MSIKLKSRLCTSQEVMNIDGTHDDSNIVEHELIEFPLQLTRIRKVFMTVLSNISR